MPGTVTIPVTFGVPKLCQAHSEATGSTSPSKGQAGTAKNPEGARLSPSPPIFSFNTILSEVGVTGPDTKHPWGVTLVAFTRWQDRGWAQVAPGQKSSPRRSNVAAGDAMGHSSGSTPRSAGLSPCCSGWHRSELPSTSPSP